MRRVLLAALLWSAAWSLPLQAAVLQLAPIPIEVPSPQKAAVLSVGNKAADEATLQLRVFRWTQENGDDRLEPTQDLAVSPPVVVVAPGQTLSARIVRLASAPPASEETYRIWVDELPVGKAKPKAGGALRILTRYSLPVFFEPADAASGEPPLTWQLARSGKGEWRLTASNAGRRRVNLSNLQLVGPDGKSRAVPAGSELTGYVLAGQVRRWMLKPPKDFPVAADGYRLTYRTEANSHSETLALVREK